MFYLKNPLIKNYDYYFEKVIIVAKGMIDLKVNDMDKYQVTERMKMLKRRLNDPKAAFHNIPVEIYEEVNNPVTDSEGFIHKYYLSDDVKSLIELIIEGN